MPRPAPGGSSALFRRCFRCTLGREPCPQVVDLGPEGGDGGGEIVAMGTPEEVTRNGRSYTGQYLKPLLKPAPAAKKLKAAE